VQLCKYYSRVICTKGKREQMWKHIINLIMNQWKCVSNTKQEWKMCIKFKILRLYKIVVFDGACFVMFKYALFFFHCDLRCYTISVVHFIMCTLCEKKKLKKLMDHIYIYIQFS